MSTQWKQRISGSLKRLLIWAILLAIWEAAYRLIGWRAQQFPAPSTLLASLWILLKATTAPGAQPLQIALAISLARLLVGFIATMAAGIAIGVLMWRFKAVDDFLGPLFLGLQTLPSIAWAPLAMLLIGSNETAVLFVVVMGSMFAVTISLRDGLRMIPPIYQRVGAMLGTQGWRRYRYVLLPSALPALASTLRQGFAFAWRSLMGAELIFVIANRGLGYLLQTARQVFNVAEVTLIMIVMVLVAIAADRLFFAPAERAIHRRFGLE